MNEMWRAREKELEMDGRPKSRRREESSRASRDTDTGSSRNRSKRHDSKTPCSTSERSYEDLHFVEDSSLKDEELEEFLQSRAKRGRGSVGPRMDETGSYPPSSPDSQDILCANPLYLDDERPRRIILGPERSSSKKRYESSDDELDEKRKRSKKASSERSTKKNLKKHKSKDDISTN